MTRPTSTLRGHRIYLDPDGETWRYEDTGEETVPHFRDRPCGECRRPNRADGHDACLGELPGVRNACCGHGEARTAHLVTADGARLSGYAALAALSRLGRGPGIYPP